MQIVLPTQIFEYFATAGENHTDPEIHVCLDVKMNLELSGDVHFEAKGFMDAVCVTGFPI